ncbi:thrombopoietin receptor [Labrus mixtus]|uniref:thrombopoietin receptor n=1 Tax=Labrus mixtus TaxID=508554 RepID=UPI0029C07C5E|nr:thrombopoietin receptor [Labrus mixtus]
MNLLCFWEILLSLWIQVCCCQDGTFSRLSKTDVSLLKDEQDPKCFTRTEQDFTCFFETADNDRTYDLLYRIEGMPRQRRCEMSVQRTDEEETVLHICSFPEMDVFVYVETHLEVVERDTNTSLFNRTVSVEDHFLMHPPFNVSLHQNGKPGQLQVSWRSTVPKYCEDEVTYEMKYSSKGLGEKTKMEVEEGDVLDLLVPGEEVQVQIRVKCAYDQDAGHWSSWSHPVWSVVPQSSDDISLTCFTSDLKYITCQWNGSRYDDQKELKLFYQMGVSKGSGWTEWTECLAERDLIDKCCFYGDESTKVRVNLISAATSLSRTFYTEKFTLNKSIKTSPPSHPKAAVQEDKLCLKWEAPLPSLSAHLQYEVGYHIRGSEEWMTRLLKGPETSTCLDVPAGHRYSVKLRAKPNGSIYSGHWSDWSDVLTGDAPTDRGRLLLLCIPVSVLIAVIILMVLFYTYHRKLKQYFWPPVPNLDKVLQGFLTEINGQKWDPPMTAKRCTEETTSSLVEIMSEDEVPVLEKLSEESTQLLSTESDLSGREQANECPGTEVCPDYVTLNKDGVFLSPKENKYVCEQVGEKEVAAVKDDFIQTRSSACSEGSASVPSCTSANFRNYSYLALAEPADRFESKLMAVRGPGNIYTNLPCS